MQHNSSEELINIAKTNLLVRYSIFFCYAAITSLGVFGNVLVLYVVLTNKSMQTITNLFIANLATSDIVMSSVSTPFTPIAFYIENWVLPECLCKLLPMTMGVSVYVSTLTSSAIAVDRYFVIVHPFVPRMKKWLCFAIILSVWFVAILISMPLAVYQKKEWIVTRNATICSEKWPRESTREVFTIVSFILQFGVPCVIISVCYFKVSMVLRVRCLMKIGTGVKTPHREEMEIRRKRKTNKMLIAMVSIFVVCWIPLNVLWMASDIHSSGQSGFRGTQYFSILFFISHLCAMSSAIYNPFLYAWMNENFKKEFKNLLPCLKFSKHVSNVDLQATKSDSRRNTTFNYTTAEQCHELEQPFANGYSEEDYKM